MDQQPNEAVTDIVETPPKRTRYLLWIVVVAIILGVVGAAYFFFAPFGAQKPDDQTAAGFLAPISWRSESGAGIRAGVRSAGQIVDVKLTYDANSTSTISISSVSRKNGFIPRRAASQNQYKLALVDASGSVLNQVAFTVPNRWSAPAPLAGEGSGGGTGDVELQKAEFIVTMAWNSSATSVRVLSSGGEILATQDLSNVQVIDNTPTFRSVRGDDFIRSYSPNALQSLLKAITPNVLAAGNEGVLDVTFIGDGYSAAENEKFHTDVNRFIARLLAVEPYKSRAAQLSFHTVDNNTRDFGCPNSYSGCNGASIVQAVNDAGVPWDKIEVIKNNPNFGGVSCDPISVSYNGSLGPDVFVHEVGGHVIGNLNDEYIFNSTQSPWVNCSPKNPNPAWQGIVGTADYYKGCDFSNYYAPSPASYMRYGAPDLYFNSVSQIAINAKLDYYAGSFSDSIPPTISMLSPKSGDSIIGTTTVNVAAADNNGIARVGLYVDGTLYKNAYLPPYSIVWGTASATGGNHTLQVKAYDAKGNVGSSAVVNVTIAVPDTAAPTTAITAPAANAAVSGIVSVSASASDNVGITKVELYKDGTLFGTVSASPYTFNWNTAGLSGSHKLQTKAYDAKGNVGTSALVTVTVAPADTVPPTVSVIAPAANATVSGTVSVTATAVDNVKVAKVELYRDGVLLNTVTTSPYITSWNTNGQTGAHKLYARAYDAKGNLGASAAVNVTVVAPDTTAPQTTITAPAANSTISGTVSVIASATDNVKVAKIELYKDGSLFSIATTSPCTFLWNTTGLSGLHKLQTKAYDAAGNVGNSPQLSVTVKTVSDTTAPTVKIVTPQNGMTIYRNASTTISMTASDAGSGVASTAILIDGKLAKTCDANCAYVWSNTVLGTHTISATAMDKSGNASSTQVTVYTSTQPKSFIRGIPDTR